MINNPLSEQNLKCISAVQSMSNDIPNFYFSRPDPKKEGVIDWDAVNADFNHRYPDCQAYSYNEMKAFGINDGTLYSSYCPSYIKSVPRDKTILSLYSTTAVLKYPLKPSGAIVSSSFKSNQDKISSDPSYRNVIAIDRTPSTTLDNPSSTSSSSTLTNSLPASSISTLTAPSSLSSIQTLTAPSISTLTAPSSLSSIQTLTAPSISTLANPLPAPAPMIRSPASLNIFPFSPAMNRGSPAR